MIKMAVVLDVMSLAGGNASCIIANIIIILVFWHCYIKYFIMFELIPPLRLNVVKYSVRVVLQGTAVRLM